ncbi:acyltransferase [Accumulibacter sp.]|uniref:acyltransferase family protein n=1 Tax=Accumulibacter sp. TaxID=2053492 RepID=UPI0025F044BA|nr:acyltransferase [Accumulibacter sp.]MCP5228901.1 acyltransferase [Accumulibacter sp.]
MKIDNLTGLRAFAALWVVLLHLRYGDLALEYGPLASIFQSGASGVTIFFALSGFILAHVHDSDFDKHLEARWVFHFLWLRLARIYPVHLFLLLCYAVGLWGFSEYDNATSFAMNITLIHAWGFFDIDGINWNQPSWSISAEWFCYLMFPLLAFVTGQGRRQVSVATVLIVIGVVIYPWLFHQNLGFSYMAQPVSAFLVFIVGYGLRILAPRLGGTQLTWALILYGALGYLGWCIFAHTLTPDRTPILSGIISLALFKVPPQFLFANRVSVYIGEISYSLYMSHIMVFTILRVIFRGPPLPLVIELMVVIACAALLHHTIEAPARNRMRRALTSRPSLAQTPAQEKGN